MELVSLASTYFPRSSGSEASMSIVRGGRAAHSVLRFSNSAEQLNALAAMTTVQKSEREHALEKALFPIFWSLLSTVEAPEFRGTGLATAISRAPYWYFFPVETPASLSMLQ